LHILAEERGVGNPRLMRGRAEPLMLLQVRKGEAYRSKIAKEKSYLLLLIE